MTSVWRNGTCDIIDPRLFLSIVSNIRVPIIREYVERTSDNNDPRVCERKYIFGVLSGAGHVKKHNQLRMIDIMRVIAGIDSVLGFAIDADRYDIRYGPYEL